MKVCLLAFVLVLSSRLAGAEPVTGSTRPPRLQAALRVGASWFLFEDDSGAANGESFNGWTIDGELGWRFAPAWALAGFATFTSARDENGIEGYDWQYRDHIATVGARLQVQGNGLFAGFGVGGTRLAERGSWTDIDPTRAGTTDDSLYGITTEFTAVAGPGSAGRADRVNARVRSPGSRRCTRSRRR